MKKLFFIIAAFSICFSMTLSSCKKEEKKPDLNISVGGMVPSETNQWVNDNTLHITASGTIAEDQADRPEIQRKELACKAASLSAMASALRLLAHSGTDSVSSARMVKSPGEERFSGIVKNGSVIEKTFDSSTNTCSIVYEIQEKDLKKKAQSAR
jgi:hypothetical protein